MSRIYKIFTPAQWDDFKTAGIFRGAPIDLIDGYIHFSTAEQAGETANKHFKDHARIIIAACETDQMTGEVKWEPSRGGALFPHLYGTLPWAAIADHITVQKIEGAFDITPVTLSAPSKDQS